MILQIQLWRTRLNNVNGDLALEQTSLNLYTSNASPVFLCQIIMLRLQQVTFMALHNFLGLSYELIASVST